MSAWPPQDSRVITFPPSLDCEFARFLLGHYRIPYDEIRHTLIFSFLPTWWQARTLHFPLLYGPAVPALDTVRKMIDHFDPLAPPDLRLLGQGNEEAQIESDWTLFNGTLGGATANFCYFHLLPHRSIMIRPLSEGTPVFEQWAVRFAYPVFKWLLTRLLKLSPDNAEASLRQIRTIVQGVDARLADGRPYLMGERFTLSDMAFADALGPLVLPEQSGAPLPSFAEMPPALKAVIAEMQASPAGLFALRIYRTHRIPPPAPGHKKAG